MSWISRLNNAIHSRRLDEDLAAEFRDHLERRAEDFERRGAGRLEAQVRATRVFGNVTAIREASRAIRLSTFLESALQDVRHAGRGLVRRPIFALTAILSLSLAAGATTAMYALVDAAILRPLPIPQPDAVVALSTSGPSEARSSVEDADLFSYPLYEELRAAAGTSARLALFDDPHGAEAQAVGRDAPSEHVIAQFVSPDAFAILGVPPAAGQLFSTTDDRFPSPRAVVVLSHEYWVRRFGADPGVVGRDLAVDGRTYSILGVTRLGFLGVEPGTFIDLWRPITTFDPSVFTNPAFRSFRLLARLEPGTTRAELALRLQPVFLNHQAARIRSDAAAMPVAAQTALRRMTLVVEPGRTGVSAFRQTFAQPLWILLAVAAGILFIACANVAGLLLARSTARATEIALRVSLGAGRVRIVRQFMAESLLLSVVATVGAWVVAHLLANVLVARVSTSADPIRLDLTFDARVLMCSLGICAVSALLLGLAPAWQLSHLHPASALRGRGPRARNARTGHVFVGVQIAFAFCLVTVGTAFLYSLRNLSAVDVGFNPAGVTVLTVANSLGPAERDLQLELTHELQTRVAALPQVQGAATAWWAMFSGARRTERVVLAGKPPSEREEVFYRVSPDYLETLRIPLLSGRDFDVRDNDNEPVPTIVNRTFARRYFGTESALGLEFRRTDGTRHQIVGVAGDSRYDEVRDGPEAIAYMPMKPPTAFTLYVRSTRDPDTVAKMVARETAALGSGMRVTDVTTLDSLVGRATVTDRLLADVGGASALLGLSLAGIGLFGLLNYSVARRTREIGIRTALGARRYGIYGLVLKDVAGMMALGLCAGLATSLLVIGWTRSLLFGVKSADPTVIGVAVGVFLATAVVACALPARRAAAIDSVIALRQD